MKIKNHRNSSRAFTLLEVMIAIGVFFLGAFAILSLVSKGPELKVEVTLVQ